MPNSSSKRVKRLVISLITIIVLSYMAALYFQLEYINGWWETSRKFVSVRLGEASHVLTWSKVRLQTTSNNGIVEAKATTTTEDQSEAVTSTEPLANSHQPSKISTFAVSATLPSPEYLVFTSGCRIPYMRRYPSKTRHSHRYSKKCQAVVDTSDLNDFDSTLNVKSTMKEQCFLIDILYDPGRPKLFREGNATPMAAETPLNTDREYLAVRCGNKHIQFHQNFPVTPQVQSKINYWKTHRSKLQISIMIVGFESTSQLHFRRSLKKTTKLLKRMNFINLHGYHTAYPATFHNFAAIHMGLTLENLQNIHSWGEPFDRMPLIWKEFSVNNYVTMYTENSESFNSWYTGWKRFRAKPTDYYGFPLHEAVTPISYRYAPNRRNCFSSLDEPEFMLNSTSRFALKFRHTPFFAFAYLGYPLHDHPGMLSVYDETLFQFFELLEESPDLLERTLIVLLGDHGPRFGAHVDIGFSTFLERSLPLFYLRVPKVLLKSFPHLKIQEALHINQNRLTTPFDLHHTLRNVFSLYKLNETLYDQPYQVVLTDRSSFFVPIHEDRSCASVNIEQDYCVCNISSDLQESENPSLNYKLYPFCIDELNKFIASQGFRRKCERFRGPPDREPHLQSAVLRKEESHSAIMLVRFTVYPQEARFETEVRVNFKSEQLERLSPFRRINKYGNQSSCVGTRGKNGRGNMQEVCICKKLRQAKG